jgi:hypothetical protein
MVSELQARLHSLYNGRQPYGGVGPQTVGLERYRLVVTGEQLYTLLEAADRIAQLEAALRKMRQFAFIDRWGGKGFDDEAQALYDEVTDIVCFGEETKVELHTCPYKVEINDDRETLCDCSPEKTQDCADDI